MKLKREIRWYEKEIKWKEACDVTEFDEVEDGTQCMMSKGMWITLYGMVWYGWYGMVQCSDGEKSKQAMEKIKFRWQMVYVWYRAFQLLNLGSFWYFRGCVNVNWSRLSEVEGIVFIFRLLINNCWRCGFWLEMNSCISLAYSIGISV